MVGVGGQGIITSSNMLSLAAMNAGHDVKKSEIHGMSQRGGSVFSHVRFGDKIHSPVITAGEADILISLEEMETLRWLDYPAHNGKVIYMNNRILPYGCEEYPEATANELTKFNLEFMELTESALKEKTGNPRTVNVAVLGLISNLLDIPAKAWEDAIRKLAPHGTGDINMHAFNEGRKIIWEGDRS